ncbi:Integrase catalytic domain-containing protein [Citrus sinensis]|nr:Integrase catalytic domain-containing protein [Citrus sinensis]
MNDHVNSFNKILADLLNLDEQFEDKDKAFLLLNSLPDEYDHLTTTLLHGKDSVTFDAVCSALYNSETIKKDRKDHRDTVAEALTARGRSQSRKLGKKSKSKGRPAKNEYAFCREKVHWKKNCPKLQKGKATSDAYVAEHDEESNFSLVGMTLICHSDEWILDSGCTYHMCPNNGWFSSFKELDGGVIFMGNDNACKTMGITIIQLKNHDGSIQVLTDIQKQPSCGICVWDMLVKKLYRLGEARLIKSDIWGPTKIASLGGMHYFVTFVDDYSRKVWVYLMKNKNEVLGIFLKWKKIIETQTSQKVKRLRSDNGGEYKNDPFLQICQDEGIVRHFTVRDTPQQNGGRTPMEMWTGKPATDYDSLHVFGSTAYYYVKKSKLDPRAKKALFMGITGGVKGYRLWSPVTKKIIFSRDVTFDESAMLKQKDCQEDDKTSTTLQQVEFEKVKVDPADQQDSIAYRRPHREIRKPARFVGMVAYALQIVDDDVPSTYREASDGFKVAGKENWVCKLTKSLYGLKQSPRQWYKRFDRFMKGQMYTRNKFDHCVYFRKLQEGSFIYLLLYVDDMLIASKSKDKIEKLKTQLNQEFEMKDLGEVKKILGMEICRDRARGKVSLSQKQYLKNVLQQFGMTEQTKPVSTPFASHFKLAAQLSPSTDAEQEYMLQVPYMYNPGKGHWQAVKWILRYIRKTVDIGLLFERDDTLGQGVIGYVDSDYAGDLDKQRSTTGYVFTFVGGPISWKSTLQSTVALSTTEAEYMTITEAIWLQGLLENLGLAQEHINVYCDSQSAIHLTKNQVYHARTKHIDVRFHFVGEIVDEGKILLQKIKTADNPADMLTKSATVIFVSIVCAIRQPNNELQSPKPIMMCKVIVPRLPLEWHYVQLKWSQGDSTLQHRSLDG